MLPEIKIYNTLHRQKELLKPITPSHITMYACGVTTYDDCHIGHAMQAIFFDTFRRYLQARGFSVTYVRNYTDVDDKIIDRAKLLGENPRDLAERIIASCIRDFKAIGVRPADFEPKVSESIPDIIAMISTLIANGAAYRTADGDVYYRVSEKADYGKLSNRKIAELRSGTRALVEGNKENPLDFALWKRDSTEGASWESPFGIGRPGWHIECSAMVKKILGNHIDIHGGGQDLIFPHHENEIAQSESANCCTYANVWMHSGLLTVNKQKMSKSLGNSITIAAFLNSWPAEVLRLSFLSSHYRSPIDFSDGIFESNRRRLLYYYETLASLNEWAELPREGKALDHQGINAIEASFHQALSDDFNTPEGIAAINVLMRLANQETAKKRNPAQAAIVQRIASLLREWGEILGLLTAEPLAMIAQIKRQILTTLPITEGEIDAQIAARQQARLQKDWHTSDLIRDQLSQKGILLRDTPSGTDWTILQKL